MSSAIVVAPAPSVPPRPVAAEAFLSVALGLTAVAPSALAAVVVPRSLAYSRWPRGSRLAARYRFQPVARRTVRVPAARALLLRCRIRSAHCPSLRKPHRAHCRAAVEGKPWRHIKKGKYYIFLVCQNVTQQSRYILQGIVVPLPSKTNRQALTHSFHCIICTFHSASCLLQSPRKDGFLMQLAANFPSYLIPRDENDHTIHPEHGVRAIDIALCTNRGSECGVGAFKTGEKC